MLQTKKTPVSATPAGAVGEDARETVVSMYQAQKKIYARAVSGWFAGWRWALVWATQLVFYGLPWLEWNARQAVLFDLGARRFYIFGLVLYPQDFIYLTGLLIVAAYSLFLFTAVAGRLWCGYACPQTVYTEIFMWVERKLEGDRAQRMRLDAAPWGVDKLLRKGGKQLAWITIGLWTGFTFVGYFTPIRSLAAAASTLGFGPWEWFWICFYGLATYGNAGWMREQVCKYMCPYARFQSVMFDADTLIITYDAARGEPRGPRSKKADPAAAGLGHCVDCGICVQVCPTGIDIRRGLQYECIGCAACIDGCNQVMDRMRYPRGLIRYSTDNALRGRYAETTFLRHMMRPRTLVYGAVLLAVVAALSFTLAVRVPLKVNVIRDRAALSREAADGRIENVYRLQVMNTEEAPRRYVVSVSGIPGAELGLRQPLEVPAATTQTFPVEVRADPAALRAGSHPIVFHVEAVHDARVQRDEKSTFILR